MKKTVLLVTMLIFAGSAFVSANGSSGDTRSDSTDLKLWTFVDTHKRFFEYVRDIFVETHTDTSITIELYDYDALYDKLTVILAAGGAGAPDMVDVEQGKFGVFKKNMTVFESLNSYLEAEGLENAIAKGRQDLYSLDGQVYGLEHALTPVVFAYRKDVFEEQGIDVPLKTWDDFIAAGKKLDEGQYMIGMSVEPGARMGKTNLFYRQTGQDISTPSGEVNINTPEYIALNQLLWDLIHTYGIAIPVETDEDELSLISAGRIVGYICADWGTGWLMDNVPDQSGLWSMMPLPILNDGDSRTSVWGGTGLAMMSNSTNKDLCWDFMKLAQLNNESAVKRFELTNLFPPLLTAYDEPGLYVESEYFGGMVPGELFKSLGAEAPTQVPTWWDYLMGEAYSKYFYDMDEGRISSEEFVSLVEKELIKRIAEEE